MAPQTTAYDLTSGRGKWRTILQVDDSSGGQGITSPYLTCASLALLLLVSFFYKSTVMKVKRSVGKK